MLSKPRRHCYKVDTRKTAQWFELLDNVLHLLQEFINIRIWNEFDLEDCNDGTEVAREFWIHGCEHRVVIRDRDKKAEQF